jgi:hypothetical protein
VLELPLPPHRPRGRLEARGEDRRVTVKQGIVEIASGEFRVKTKRPTTLEIPNLRITFAAADAKPWQDWFDDFVIKGNNGPAQQKGGAIDFLDPSGTTLGSVSLVRCGIFALDLDPSESARDGARRCAAELYVEGMQLDLTEV